jgi:hypothetical protein
MWIDSNGDDSLIFSPGDNTNDITMELYQNKNVDIGGNLDITGDISAVKGTFTQSTGSFPLVTSTPYDFTAKFESTDAGAYIVLEDSGSTNNANYIGVNANDFSIFTAGALGLTINSSQNATFAGTISSGAITSTGTSSFGVLNSSGNIRAGNGSTTGNVQFTSSSYQISGGSGVGDLRFVAPRFRFYEDNTSGTAEFEIDGGNATFTGTISSGAITLSNDSSDMGFGTAKAGSTISHTASVDEGIFWHTSNDYGIFRPAGTWSSPNYQQLRLKWLTGIELDGGGTTYAKSGINFLNGNIKMDGTQILDASRNLVNIGTISSGAITSSGASTFSHNVNIDKELRLDARYDGGSGDNVLAFKDSSGNYSIRHNVNDGNGNYSISLGYSGTGSGQYAVTGDGVGKILFSGHGQDGGVSLNAAQTGTAGNNINFSIGLLVESADNTIRVGASNNGTGLDASEGVKVFDASGNAFATSYSVGSTTVIDSSRNLTVNQDIVSSGTNPLVLSAAGGGANIELYGSAVSNQAFFDASQVNFRGVGGSGTGSIAIGTTVVIDSSRNLTNIGTISSGQINTTTAADATPAIIATNTGGVGGIIQRWVGDSDSMEMQCSGTGDYKLRNTQQNNGINFYDGTGGVEIEYSGTMVQEWDSAGGTNLATGSFKVGGTEVVSPARDIFSDGLTIGSWGIGSNTGQGRIGKASDRTAGTITNQIGGGSSAYWEIVDYAWSTVAAQCNNSGDFTAYRDFNTNTGGYEINGTTVIDSSRNLTNIAKITGNSSSGGTTTFNVGRGDVYFENNTYSNANGAGITLRTSSNPTTGSIFDVRSSGQACRFFVGQSITTAGDNPFYVGDVSTGGESTASNYEILLDTNGDITAEGNITAYGTVSDIRQKENIEQIDKPIERLEKIKGITFNYKKKSEDERLMGVIAQDLLKDDILKLAVYEQEDFKAEDDDPLKHTYGVRYEHLTAILIEAVKEQQEQIESLKSEINNLKGEK